MNTNRVSQSLENICQELFQDASEIPCEEANNSFLNDNYPYFYDKQKFQRGQRFFYKNYASMISGMLLSLIIGFTEPKLNFFLQHTQQSNTPEKAFRRYKSTIKHILTWYKSDFRPGSESWDSLKYVKLKHNSSSKSVSRRYNMQITQWDMAIVQFGFVFPVLLIGKEIGLKGICEEDLSGFLHIWRNFGYVLGIEDRFNICKDSIEETKLICDSIMKQHILPLYMEGRSSTYYLYMVDAFLKGLKMLIPLIHQDIWFTIAKHLMFKYANEEVTFTSKEKIYIQMHNTVNYLQNFQLFRYLINLIFKIIVWVSFYYTSMTKFL